MRISDWSSDVCSSDLPRGVEPVLADVVKAIGDALLVEPAPRLLHRVAVRNAIENHRHAGEVSRHGSQIRGQAAAALKKSGAGPRSACWRWRACRAARVQIGRAHV